MNAPTTRMDPPAIEAIEVVRRFRGNVALRGVSLRLLQGEIHALLGPNGAGKTTLLRILSGLASPDEGEIRAFGRAGHRPMTMDARAVVGLVPSGDRSFYLRLSGLENLRFFGRLYGLSKREATARARERLRWVDLEHAATRIVGEYSHGMQKRLSIARGLMMDPPILLVDEATHDLDPEAATTVRHLVVSARDRGTAVVWATQRLDEIRGFADRVTVLHGGLVRFQGSVPQLMAMTSPRRYVVQLRSEGVPTDTSAGALHGIATLTVADDGGDYALLELDAPGTLGRALAALEGSGFQVLTCREERSEIETAFLALTNQMVPSEVTRG